MTFARNGVKQEKINNEGCMVLTQLPAMAWLLSVRVIGSGSLLPHWHQTYYQKLLHLFGHRRSPKSTAFSRLDLPIIHHYSTTEFA